MPKKSAKTTKAKKTPKRATVKRSAPAMSSTPSYTSSSSSNASMSYTPFLITLLIILGISLVALAFSVKKQNDYFGPREASQAEFTY